MNHKSATNTFVKECMVAALQELMKEKCYEDITISEIVKKAGVSRMAYYRNYSSKEDIIQKALEDYAKITDNYTIPLFESGDLVGYIEYLFEDFRNVSGFYKCILKAHLGDMILKYFNHCTFLFISRYCDPQPRKFQILAFSGACYNMAITWILDGMKESPRQMAQIFLGTVDARVLDELAEYAQQNPGIDKPR